MIRIWLLIDFGTVSENWLESCGKALTHCQGSCAIYCARSNGPPSGAIFGQLIALFLDNKLEVDILEHLFIDTCLSSFDASPSFVVRLVSVSLNRREKAKSRRNLLFWRLSTKESIRANRWAKSRCLNDSQGRPCSRH